MERLNLRLQTAKNALLKFEEVLNMPFSNVVRDASIQRFEFTLEAIWKITKHYLREQEGIEVTSPKSAARLSQEQSLLTEEQTHKILKMIDDRNLTVHVYNEPLADEIFHKLPEYFVLLRMWLLTIENRMSINK